MPKLGSLPDGSRGFDCNTTVTPDLALAFAQHGYKFAVRYVRRSQKHDYDLTVGEIVTLLASGLGVMVVQHVAADGWVPSGRLGTSYGQVAAGEAHALGLPVGTHVWCDLEGVMPGTPAGEVIDFCNRWYDAVADAGYRPGLYVGWSAILTPIQLYRNLKFRSYWAAYNLDRDQEPITRGVQMRQFGARPLDRPPGVAIDFDVNVIRADRMGGSPTLLLPDL